MTDNLTRFPQTNIEVRLASEEGNTIDNVVAHLSDIERRLLIAQNAKEVHEYGDSIEDNEEIMENVPPKEVDDA